MATATFGAGCFWGIEETFRQTEGITETAVGYMGGSRPNPTYEDVCRGNTGHVEVVQVTYDPDTLSYAEVVQIFFDNHNPTQVNRQGPDIGTQYRTVIFFHDQDQKDLALKAKSDLDASGRFKAPIATAVEEASTFWKAEEYHQQYLAKRGLMSCGF